MVHLDDECPVKSPCKRQSIEAICIGDLGTQIYNMDKACAHPDYVRYSQSILLGANMEAYYRSSNRIHIRTSYYGFILWI